MSQGLRVPPTIYDNGMHPWQQNINDLVDFKRAFKAGDAERKMVNQALISASPVLPRAEIRANMTTRKFPPRFGYPDGELTIRQVLANRFQQDAEINVSEWNNFSGSQGEINATSRPSVNGIF